VKPAGGKPLRRRMLATLSKEGFKHFPVGAEHRLTPSCKKDGTGSQEEKFEETVFGGSCKKKFNLRTEGAVSQHARL